MRPSQRQRALTIHRGEIWHCLPDPITIGHEQNGARPVLIVQSEESLQVCPVIKVVPLTAAHKSPQPRHVVIPAGQFGLTKRSIILCEQLTRVDRSRLTDRIGVVDETTMAEVDTRIFDELGLGEGVGPHGEADSNTA